MAVHPPLKTFHPNPCHACRGKGLKECEENCIIRAEKAADEEAEAIERRFKEATQPRPSDFDIIGARL